MQILFILIITKSVFSLEELAAVTTQHNNGITTKALLPIKRITRPKYAINPTTAPTVYVPPSITMYSNSFVPAFIPTNYFSNNIPQVNLQKRSAYVKIDVTVGPTKLPSTKPSKFHTTRPSKGLTTRPSKGLTTTPSKGLTTTPSKCLTSKPSIFPSKATSSVPPVKIQPAIVQSATPSFGRTVSPSVIPTGSPSLRPTGKASRIPAVRPSLRPSLKPSVKASDEISTKKPSCSPTTDPTKSFPTVSPTTYSPTATPTAAPRFQTTKSPLRLPTTRSTSIPSAWSTVNSIVPPISPTNKATVKPTVSPTVFPTVKGGRNKQSKPSWQPSTQPSFVPREDDITYHNNGSVILSPKIYNIYVGPFTTTTMDLIDYLAANIDKGRPDWYSVLRGYTQVVGGKLSRIGNPVFKERWTFSPTSNTLTDESLQSMIRPNLVSKNLLNCSDCIFAIIFNGGFQMAGWTTHFCGYHTRYGYGPYSANILVVGDPMSANPPYYDCVSYLYSTTANGDQSADSIATTYMHEVAEVITDFDGNTWYSDSNGYEVADYCNFFFGDFDYQTVNSNYMFGNKKFLVQYLFEPRIGCVQNFRLTSNSNQQTNRPVTAPTKSPSLPADMNFHESGGVVVDATLQTGITLYNVYLGSMQDSTKNLVDYFGSRISSTSWYQILTSYFDLVSGKWVDFNSRFSMGQSTSIQPTEQALQLTEEDIRNYLLPLYNPNTSTPYDVYAVMFRGDFNISIEGKLWLKDWCSYHGSFLILPQNYVFKYFIVGDPSTAPGQLGQVCAPIFGNGRMTANGDLGGDSIAVGYAQQLAQTLTNFAHYTWYSDTGNEVSTACLGKFGPGFNLARNNSNIMVGNKKFLVQEIWQRSVGCTLRKK